MLDLHTLTSKENFRQKNTLNLIASENYPSPEVRALLGAVWSTKYAEGQPGKRYYAGNVYSDELEIECMKLALEVFNAEGYGCNVQILSGSPANATVYHTVLEVGDTVLSLSLADGGHLSHLHATSVYNKYYKFAHYGIKETAPNSYEIDLEDYTKKLTEIQPKLVILGYSAYPKQIPFEDLIRIAHENGALVLADVAHINGLIAAGLHPSPFSNDASGADFVSMTTHKTLRGPRSGIIFAKDKYMKDLNRAIFPGQFGGPHLNKIAALARCFQEILGQEKYPDGRSFKEYTEAVIENCKALEHGLKDGGLSIISPTENHLCLVALPDEVDSLEMQQYLESVGIITNRNAIPNDTKSPWRPGGMRFGSAALTSRGATKDDMYLLGQHISKAILGEVPENDTVDFVNSLVSKLQWYYS